MKVPEDLDDAGSKYWRIVTRHWRLDDHQPEILRQACRCLDLIASAEVELAKTGPIMLDRFGQQKAAPAVMVIRDYRTLFARLVRELGLSAATEAAERLPKLTGRYRGRD